MQTFSSAQHHSKVCSATHGPVQKPSFCIKPHFLHICKNQGYDIPARIYRALPSLYPAPGNYQHGPSKEQGTTLHRCFSLRLTPLEPADHIPPGPTEVGGKVTSELHQQPSSSTSPLHGSCLHRDGKAWHWGQPAALGSDMFLLCTKATLAFALQVLLACNVLPCSRPQTLDSASPCSIFIPSRQPAHHPILRIPCSKALMSCNVLHLQCL